MKQLICASHVEEAVKNRQTFYQVEPNAIITPAARDAAKLLGLTFSEKCRPDTVNAGGAGVDLDPAMIYQVLKAMMEAGSLEGIFNQKSPAPYTAERGPGGLKLVRGDSVRMDKLGTAASNVFCQEVAGENGTLKAGFLTIDHSCFNWELSVDEVYFVIGGTVEVSINGHTFTAKKGDVVYMPRGAVTIRSPDCAKIFYAALGG